MSAARPNPDRACPTADVLRRFALSIAGLLKLVFHAFPAVANPPISAPDLYNYISRTSRRFERLLVRLAAGVQPRPRPAPRPPEAAPAAAPKPRATPRLRLPRRFAWLRAALGHNAGNLGSQIAFLLDESETAALVAASPQAQRLLRPLFNMLGVVAPACIPPLPPRARKPRPRPEPRPRPVRPLSERRAWSWRPSPPRLFQQRRKPA
jgi:hypothetical protein